MVFQIQIQSPDSQGTGPEESDQIKVPGSNLTYKFHIISASNCSTVTHRKAFKAYVYTMEKNGILTII